MTSHTDGSFELGYNGVPWTRRTSPEDVYYHKAAPPRRLVGSFGKECVNAAKEIRATHAGTIFIPLSGGLDSEGLAESFYRAGIAFTPIIVEYLNDINCHDVDYATAYCKARGLTPIIEQLDLDSFFLKGHAQEMAILAQGWELAYMPVLSVLQRYKKEGFWIGPGEASISKDAAGNWIWGESERHYCYNKFMDAVGVKGVASFYQWSTELVHSQLLDPLLVALASGYYNNAIWSSSLLKQQLYRKHLGLTPRTKYTGFEQWLGVLNVYNKKWRASPLSELCQNQPSDILYWSQIHAD